LAGNTLAGRFDSFPPPPSKAMDLFARENWLPVRRASDHARLTRVRYLRLPRPIVGQRGS